MAIEIEPSEMSEVVTKVLPTFVNDKYELLTGSEVNFPRFPGFKDICASLDSKNRIALAKIIEVSEREIRAIAATDEMKSQGRTGASVIISNREAGLPPIILEVDEVVTNDKDFGQKSAKHWVIGLAKNRYADTYPWTFGSTVNLESETKIPKWKINGELVPAGSACHHGWNVAVSGFVGKNDSKLGETDEACAIAILYGSGQFDSFNGAKRFAKSLENQRFISEFDLFVDPILD